MFSVNGVRTTLLREGSRLMFRIGGRPQVISFRVSFADMVFIDFIFANLLLVDGVATLLIRAGSHTMSRIGGRLGDGNTLFTVVSWRGVFLSNKSFVILSCHFLLVRESVSALAVCSW